MEDSAGHASRYGGLLHLEASRARVFESGFKTGGGVMMGGARGTLAVLVIYLVHLYLLLFSCIFFILT
jgi:hypothetical protein